MTAADLRRDLEAERFRVLTDMRALADLAGIPRDLLPCHRLHEEDIRVVMERGRRRYLLEYEDWRGPGPPVAACDDANGLLEVIFRNVTAKLAEAQVREELRPGESPSERTFARRVELMSRVHPEWGERLQRSEGQMRGLPGWRKL
jgi:hypothetical protein